MAKQKSPQKISIVFEDTGGNSFNVYMDGHTRNLNHVKEDDLSPAEFWSLHMLAIVADLLKQSGVVASEFKRPNDGVKGH
jgi:hypothetical protein